MIDDLNPRLSSPVLSTVSYNLCLPRKGNGVLPQMRLIPRITCKRKTYFWTLTDMVMVPSFVPVMDSTFMMPFFPPAVMKASSFPACSAVHRL